MVHINCQFMLMMGERVHTVKEKAEAIVIALVVASKESGLEVNADKTKNMVISREQHAGQHHSMMTGDRSFERVEQFKYLETTLTNQTHKKLRAV